MFGEPKRSWADKYEYTLGFDSPLLPWSESSAPWAQRFPLETRLFKEFLSTVPENFPQNPDTWAYVVVGFENELKARLDLNAVTGASHTQQALSGTRWIDPSSWIDRVDSFLNASDTASFAKDSKEYLEIMLNRGRPQFFNRENYEVIFGKPPHLWGAYGNGWQTPGLPVEKKK